MDPDDAAQHPARRTSAAHDRPSRAPSGPRIRTRPPRHSPDVPSPGPPSADGPASPLFSSQDSPGPGADLAIDASFTLSPFFPLPLPSPVLTAHADAAVQTPSSTPDPSPSPSPSLSPSPAPAPNPATAAPRSAPATFIAPPPLTPPPTISFEPTPIPWKGLPLEAAQWSFSSSELQEIVSRAIRFSARESFVRLLSLQALEVDTVHESERLDAERAAAQAKWRFEVGRRTMLVQALNSSVASSVPNGDLDGTITGFIGQLASSIASCDTLLASVLHLSDQQSQIALVQHQHWASALSVALRKLNKAHERQGQELKRTQARVQTLEDELEEAWREAEKMAIEFDDFEQEAVESTEEDGSEGREERPDEDTLPDSSAAAANVIRAHDTGLEAREQDLDETGTLGDATINTDIAVVRGVTAIAFASKATLVTSPGSPRFPDGSDTRSLRSVKSARSRRSTRDGPSHASRVSAARTRSRAASNASLRLPKALRSAPPVPPSPVDAPPMPILPQDHSFLDMGNVTHEPAPKAVPPPRLPEPSLTLPTPPHSAGLPQTRVPSIWLETDGGQSTPLNGLDRTHSLQIFSSLMARGPRRARRSNLVMSLTGSDRSSDSPVDRDSRSGSGSRCGSASGSGPGSSTGVDRGNANANGNGNGREGGSRNGHAGTSTPSPTANSSPISLPTHALAHFRGPSLSSDSRSLVGTAVPRPGSAGARLTTAECADARSVDTKTGDGRTPRRSLVSRASSVILRRLSQATVGSSRSGAGAGGGGKGAGKGAGKGVGLTSPSKSRSRETLGLGGGRTLERCKEGDAEGEGEVMLIGSPHVESFDGP